MRRTGPPLSSHLLAGPDPDRIAKAEARRLALPLPDDLEPEPAIPPGMDDAIAMACRLGVSVAADHYRLDRSELSRHVSRAKRTAPPGTYPRAPVSYSCFLLRQY